MTDISGPVAPSTSGESGKGKPWVRWVALGCFAALLLGGLLVVAIGAVVLKSIKSSGAYQEALAGVQASPGVEAALGEPVEEGWWVAGSINVTGPSGDAEISFPISGPGGKAKVFAEGKKQAGEWDLHLLEVELGESGERVDVLSERESNSLEVIESFLALVAREDYEAAHDHFARPLEEVQPYDAFEAIARNNDGLFRARELRLEKSQGEGGPSYKGTLLLESGHEVPAAFDLIREGGRWRLIAYNIGS